MIKKLVSLLFATVLVVSIAIPNISFASDITNHQMATELTYWANKGVILPDSKGNYNPDRAVTRGEFASYITRALELPISNKYTFSDVKGARLIREVQSAAGAGILSGYPDGTFKPYQNITRQQMAGMLYNALKYLKVPLNKAPLTFKDNYRIYSSFTNGVATSVYYNIIRGDHTSSGVYFRPKDSATIAHAAAFLYRMYFTAADYNNNLPQNGEVDASAYLVGSLSGGSVTVHPTIYQTYDEALAAYNASSSINLIYKGDKIIKMENGIAFSANTAGNITSIYANRDFTNQITYITEGRELKYNGSNGDYAIVQVGDIVGYAKISDVTLVPTSLIDGRDQYTVSNSVLSHKTYNHVTGTYEGQYIIGPAPTFMQSGVNYHSFDGVHFYNSSNKLVGTYFPYFQFASVRQPSNYTAGELDQIINTFLADRQATGYTQYKDATTKSKLIGLGSFIKSIEQKDHVNGLFILAAAIHESNYGMSSKAQTYNNLFGIKVYDADGAIGEKYASPSDSIVAFIERYLNVNYIPQSGRYSFGAVPGNKTTGINVYYASDPHWGSKIAGHMYRMDARFGQKDYGNNPIGMVLASGSVNTRLDASTSSSLAYTYKQKNLGESGEFGYPVSIVDQATGADGYVWYKVYSDAIPPANYVWIRSDLVNKLPQY